jgi:hypothetical protein
MAKLVSRAMLLTAYKPIRHMIPYPISPQIVAGSRYLLSVSPGHARFDLAQHLAHPKNAINEHAISRTLDLEVSEESVGAEQGKNLI